MDSISLQSLSEPIRSFLEDAAKRGGMIVKDEAGQPRYRVLTLKTPTSEEKERAWNTLERIQTKVAASMKSQGVTEEDVDHLLQDDES